MAVERFLSLMDQLEADYRPRLASNLEAGMLAMTEMFLTTRLPGPAPANQLPELAQLLRTLWAESVTESAELFFDLYRDGFPAEAKSNDAITGLIESYIQTYGANTAQQILDTSRNQIRNLMSGGLAAGEAADAVYASVLEKIPGLSEVRSLLISRTEIHAATQFAAWQMARRSSIPLVKVWNTVKDERTRDFGEVGRISQFNHRSMDQTRVAINGTFLVPRIVGGYETLMFPGDPRGSAGNIINCRCIQTYERA